MWYAVRRAWLSVSGCSFLPQSARRQFPMKSSVILGMLFVNTAVSLFAGDTFQYRPDRTYPPFVSFVYFGNSDVDPGLFNSPTSSASDWVRVEAELDGVIEFAVDGDVIAVTKFDLTLDEVTLGLPGPISELAEIQTLADAFTDGAQLGDLLETDPTSLSGIVAPRIGSSFPSAFIGDYGTINMTDGFVTSSMIPASASAYFDPFAVGASRLSLTGRFLSRSELQGTFRVSQQTAPGPGFVLLAFPNFVRVPEPSCWSIAVFMAVMAITETRREVGR